MAVLLALSCAAFGGTADFLGGTMARRLPSVAVVGASQAVGLVLLAALTLGSGALAGSGASIGWALGGGVALAVGLVSFYGALAAGTMGVVAPIAALGVVVPLAWGLLSGDSPSSLQLAGVTLGLVGIVVSSGPDLGDRVARRPVLLSGLAGTGFGTSMLMSAQGSAVSVLTTVLLSKVAIVLPLLGLALMRSTVGGVRPRHAPMVGAVGAADAGAALSFGYASTLGLVSLVSVISSLYPVATIVLARVVHRERITVVQGSGVVTALVGVACMAVG